MAGNQLLQSQVSTFTTEFFTNYYGQTPGETEVIYKAPFLLIHIKDFLLPSEELLINSGQTNRVLESRDLLMHSVKDTFLKKLLSVANLAATDLFFDWNLKKKNGLLLIVIDTEMIDASFTVNEESTNSQVKEIIQMNSSLTQKKPEETDLYWLSSSILLVRRSGILVDIEKELIKNGAIEELRLAKRPMEYRITKFFNLNSFLPGAVKEIFVDWNFSKDLSYMVLILDTPGT